jgi:hypothetical protein
MRSNTVSLQLFRAGQPHPPMRHDFNFLDLVAATRGVAPHWTELRKLMQQSRELRRQARLSRSVQTELELNARLDEVSHRAKALTSAVSGKMQSGDPTGKLSQLATAIAEFERQCAAGIVR